MAGLCVAMLASVATTGSGSGIGGSLFQKLQAFIRDLLGDNLLSRLDSYEQRRKLFMAGLVASRTSALDPVEIAILIVGSILYALAFLIAGKTYSIEQYLIFLVVAGLAIALHEVGHHYFAHARNISTEIQVWIVGIIFMFITAPLAGVVFSKPCRQIIGDTHNVDQKHIALTLLSGSVISIILAMIWLGISFLGGIYATIGQIGFLVNMPLAIFSMIPLKPWEGKEVYGYNKVLWAVIFIPITVLYFFVLFQ